MSSVSLRCLNLAIFTTCLLGGAAASAAVFLVDDDRYTRSLGQFCHEFSCEDPFDDTFTPPAPFVAWVIAGQNSTVSTSRMQGIGFGSSYSDVGWSQSLSVYEVRFNVTSKTNAHLQGELTADIVWGWPEAGVQLSGPSGLLHDQVINDSSFEDGSFDENLVLQPGLYVIRVWADGGTPIADASFDFTLDLTNPPLCGLGFEVAFVLPVVMGLRRRRRANP